MNQYYYLWAFKGITHFTFVWPPLLADYLKHSERTGVTGELHGGLKTYDHYTAVSIS